MSRINIDWTLCDGHGLCARLLPERIHTDDWGFPIIDATPLSPEQDEDAHRAIHACPQLALNLAP